MVFSNIVNNDTKKAGPTVVDIVALTLESAFSGRPYMVL